MSDVLLVTLWQGRETDQPALPTTRRPQADQIGLIAIAASTGGPGVLRQILKGLPESFSIPIVVVQHITPGFGQGFAHWLGSITPLRISAAKDGERARLGQVIITPDDQHIAGCENRHSQ
jgi:two-component system chemotaxis response regulator CheB